MDSSNRKIEDLVTNATFERKFSIKTGSGMGFRVFQKDLRVFMIPLELDIHQLLFLRL
jgi:hypothetical protein